METPFLLFLICCLSPLSVKAFSIVPERIVTPFLDIFNKKNHEEGGAMKVMVSTYDENALLEREGETLLLDLDTFAKFKKQAGAVYRVMGKKGSGTAFHIGHNLVLTNHHVLDKSRRNLTQCREFALNDRRDDKKFACKKVHHCNADLDVCLIEMSPIKKSRLCLFCRQEPDFTYLTDGPKLQLKDDVTALREASAHDVFTAIGNSKGLGIHLTQGQGLELMGIVTLNFYAPILPGNSGGPLLDAEGSVVGLVKAESAIHKIGSDVSKVFNLATTSHAVILTIRGALKKDPETLLKFNESVIE